MAGVIVAAYLMDLVFGDPRWFPHPVKGIGKLITFLEKRLRGVITTKRVGRIKGVILAVIVIGISCGCAYIFLELSRKAGFFINNLVGAFLAYTTLSVKDLHLHANEVLSEITKDDISAARLKLSRMVGRDAQNLSKEEIIKAAIESVAENTNDGIIAPLFYLFLGGPLMAICYKAINTLDSMVGYKNERYIHLGWFSAKVDDAVNFIPARITGILIPAAFFILGKGFTESLRIMLRDRLKHSSPNSAVSIAAMAGGLKIRLGGQRFYHGKLSENSFIGEENRSIDYSLIREALIISLLVSLLMVGIGSLIQWVLLNKPFITV